MLPSVAMSPAALPPFIAAETLRNRVTELAHEIRCDVPDEDRHLVCVLKGAVMFLADLVRAMNGGVTMDFMALSSYAGTTSSALPITLALAQVRYGRRKAGSLFFYNND